MGKYDSAWKDILKAHFKDFILFYFPHIAGSIDFTQPVQFLDKELAKLAPRNRSPGRLADLLVKVHSCTGKEQLLYCHVEVQGRKEPAFTVRLFQYAYRIYDRFKSFPVTLVVLTDSDPDFYPDAFEIINTGKYLRVEFQVAKLLYFKERVKQPKYRDNPFACVTEVQLEVNELKGHRRRGMEKAEAEYKLKKKLVLRLYESGYRSEYIRSLLLFLDWMVQLPEELEGRLTDEITEERGGNKMSYVTSWERIGMKKGKQEDLIRLLDKKFTLTEEEQEIIKNSMDVNKLNAAIDVILFAQTKEEVLKLLR